MDQAMRLPGRHQTGVITDAKEVATSRSRNIRIMVFFVLFAVAIYGVVSWFRIDSLKETNGALTTEVDGLKADIKALKAEASSVATLKGQLTTTKADLSREIARKNELAVENTRLKGRITQAERDLKAALDRITLLEKRTSKRK